MSNADIQRELEQLRKEIAALSAARQLEGQAPAVEEEEPPITTQSEESERAMKGHVEELLELVQDEMSDLRTITTLAVFVAGIAVGRYLR